MIKLLLLTSLFCICTFFTFCQSSDEDTCKVNPKVFKVVVKQDAYDAIESQHVIPRNLKEFEYCLVKRHRHESEIVVIGLDSKHELIIYPYSDIEP